MGMGLGIINSRCIELSGSVRRLYGNSIQHVKCLDEAQITVQLVVQSVRLSQLHQGLIALRQSLITF